MWQIKTTELSGQNGKRVSVLRKQKAMSFREVLDAWTEQAAFRDFYTAQLSAIEYSAFFWEHPPLSLDMVDNDYEFVLIPSQRLESLHANPAPFQEHFQGTDLILDFSNLGGDAHLVVPRPTQDANYAHLAIFLRTATKEQIDLFWERIGQLTLRYLGNRQRWLSTAGLGVSWLHVRLDSYPKYYRCSEYRKMLV